MINKPALKTSLAELQTRIERMTDDEWLHLGIVLAVKTTITGDCRDVRVKEALNDWGAAETDAQIEHASRAVSIAWWSWLRR